MAYCCSTGAIRSRREWLAAGFFAALSCARPKPLPVYSTVPPFRLTAQTGAPFDSTVLGGAPWLASFFFASCNGPCPRMNAEIYNLQEQTYSYRNLKLVSFTVDPEHDTPEVLAAYARRYKADPARWYFLTGSRDTISTVARDGFQIGALDAAQSHSTRIMLIDGAGRVRGHYPSAEKDDIQALLAGISALYQENS
ncbi:MAG: SCO family protein [Acidobacteria bacterium]|nr:SCO family protein [Acidobacteriota bacterium]